MESVDGCNHRDDSAYISELETSLKSLKTIIDCSEAGMYVTDFETGEILYANPKMVALGGYKYTVDDIVGEKCWEFINFGYEERCPFCPYKKLLGANGELLEPYTWEHYFADYGIWLKIISKAIIWSDGRLAHMNTFYDVTESKRIQEEIAVLTREKENRRMQRNLQEVLDTLPIPVRITDSDTAEIVYVNNACVKMFDYPTQKSMVGLPILAVLPAVQSDGTESKNKIDTLLNTRDSIRLEVEYLTSKGVVIDGRITVCNIEFEGRRCALGIITDLSAEREQRRMLQNAADKERAANKLKSNFLSNMSHEIRTPMNAVIGLTEIELRKRHTKESTEVYKKINISAKSLLQIVNDILDMSKIEADKLELFPDEFELEEVLNNALLVASPRLEGKRVELMPDISLELPRYLVGDKTRLWQILKNYLDNAAKYTQEGYILLTVVEDTAQSTEDTVYIRFALEDTGIGMNNEQMRKAFLPYEQVYSEAQNKYTGTGLGLPLSKRICELMGGSMKIASTPGQGTTICFTLPFARSKKRDKVKQKVNVPNLAGLKILAVDDSELALRIIDSLIKKSGAELITARSSEEALKLIGGDLHFDIILLDLVMADDNGIALAEKCREIVQESTKILIVTAYGSHIEKDDLTASGICDLIEKPFVPSLFFGKLMVAAGYKDEKQESDSDNFTTFKDVRVLVCEDNEINQMVAAGMLEQFGIIPYFAENGEVGIEMLNRGESFDLVLMDVHMPIMDGYEAARHIRADSRFDNLPIISLTADAMTEVIDQCLASGMNDYLSKPFEMSVFNKLLLKWLPESKRVY